MTLLDTNVVSAVMAPSPVPAVLRWLDRQATEDLYLSAVTVAEIAYGLRGLPDGTRRRALSERFERFVALGFDQRVLSFDSSAALAYAEIMGHCKEVGRPMSVLDGQIAAVARSRRMALATRNTRDFEECGLEVVSPFAEA